MGRKKILIVEDELDMRIFLVAAFETSGYQPVAVRNGKEGLEKAAEISPDLIVLDVMMPGEGGVTLYRRLRTDAALKTIPILMLSAVEKETYYHYLKMLNLQLEDEVPLPNAYLEKPPDPDELLQTVERLIA